MSTQEMDYFNQRPDLDMKPFYQTRSLKVAGGVKTGIAPPPPDQGWASQEEEEDDEKR